ncbi:MAG: RnfABCDGE type electron transport complex subunit B [Casimicrobiaceae bacterium]
MAGHTLAQRIDAVLPQTQCTRCGYAGCQPYADAIAQGNAAINRCPPGGDAVIAALAALTGGGRAALDPACGAQGPLLVAVIDEAACIGCTLCIQACPVDAIIGAQKRMHAILPSLCSGCELCVAPCPVDCIAMLPASREWTAADAEAARIRHRQRNARVARRERIVNRKNIALPPGATEQERRRAAVAAALARARARRGA